MTSNQVHERFVHIDLANQSFSEHYPFILHPVSPYNGRTIEKEVCRAIFVNRTDSENSLQIESSIRGVIVAVDVRNGGQVDQPQCR